MKVVKAPQRLPKSMPQSIFLAGSIEQGEAIKWQEEVTAAIGGWIIKGGYHDDVIDLVVLNPRRDDWDASWSNDGTSKELTKQIKWERNALEAADYLFFYFDPKTKSIVTMLELGEFCNKDTARSAIVVCPEEYCRYANVEAFCDANDIDLYHTMEEGLEELKQLIEDEY